MGLSKVPLALLAYLLRQSASGLGPGAIYAPERVHADPAVTMQAGHDATDRRVEAVTVVEGENRPDQNE